MPEDCHAPSREWNADVYHRVSAPQVSWGKKVLARISLHGDETVLDAGCGTGRLTRELLEGLPRGRVVAVDLSQNMVKTAREYLVRDFPRQAEFLCCDLLHLPFRDAFDGIFSTATFHWVLDHQALFGSLHSALHSGGWLCGQCGGSGNIAAFLSRAGQLMATPLYAGYFAGFQFPWEYPDPQTTAERLTRAGFTDIETSLEEAPAVLASAGAYREFICDVILRHHLKCIPTPLLRHSFIEKLVEQATTVHPPFYLDYRRLNIRARKEH